ncbi:MAG: P-loop NTPase fold protein [Anaerolineales bacterium]|jgi:hypothetical protein
MLQKNTEIKDLIDSKTPFSLDRLNRKPVAENLTRVIQSTKQPFVISIEAPWGWGKTTFIHMWKAYLENEGHSCLYFNAWETDFSEDPLIAFIGEMDEHVNNIKLEKSQYEKLAKIWNKVKDISGEILKRTLPLAIQLATHGLLSAKSLEGLPEMSDEIAKFASDLAKERINQYSQEKRGINAFKEKLSELVKIVTDSEKIKPPLIFFIDEMDRCRPDYALALLERIKHLFSVEGIVFILSIDRVQMSEVIKAIYGIEMKPEGYLRRFIDVNYSLQTLNCEGFSSLLFNKFNLSDIIADENKQIKFREIFNTFAHSYKDSLRVQEQTFTDINLILRSAPRIFHKFSNLVPLLVFLKHHESDLFQGLIEGNPNNQKILDIVKGLHSNSEWVRYNYPPFIEIHLKLGTISESEFISWINKVGVRYSGRKQPEAYNSLLVVHFQELGDFRRVDQQHSPLNEFLKYLLFFS